MKQILKDFIIDIFRQLIAWSKQREGKIILTPSVLKRMREYELNFETLEDVFRHREGKAHKIVLKYAKVIVGIYYKSVKSKNNPLEYTYVITKCWKQKRYYRR